MSLEAQAEAAQMVSWCEAGWLVGWLVLVGR